MINLSQILLLLISWSIISSCQDKTTNALEEKGVLEPESEQVIFLTLDANGLYRSDSTANSESPGVAEMDVRFVSRLPITNDSIFKNKYSKRTEQVIFARKAPFILCQSSTYAAGRIYYRTYSDGMWSGVQVASLGGATIFVLPVSDEVKKFKIIKVQFK